MSRLLLFNPDNDLALASGLSHYMAPRNARLIREAGQALPLWWADEGDVVASANSAYLEEIIDRFNLNGTIMRDPASIDEAMPWGWSLAAKTDIAALEVAPSALPDDDKLAAIRALSHRRVSIEINSRLADLGFTTPPLPVEARDAKELKASLAALGDSYIKAPWSSSGRGVLPTASMNIDEISRRAVGIIERQGSVMIEKALAKKLDFAMLFHIDGPRTAFKGLSLFNNTRSTAYAGNIVAPQSRIDKAISTVVGNEKLAPLAGALEAILADVVRDNYKGWAGIDMMAYTDDNGATAIAPCVELNLRMTMGCVALTLAQKHMAECSEGSMTVTFRHQSPSSQLIAPQDSTLPPDVVIADGKLVEGAVEMAPPNPHFSFRFEARRNDKGSVV